MAPAFLSRLRPTLTPTGPSSPSLPRPVTYCTPASWMRKKNGSSNFDRRPSIRPSCILPSVLLTTPRSSNLPGYVEIFRGIFRTSMEPSGALGDTAATGRTGPSWAFGECRQNINLLLITDITMEQLIRPREAARMLGIGRSTLYALAAKGLIPKPQRLTERCSVWKASELQTAVDVMILKNSAEVSK